MKLFKTFLSGLSVSAVAVSSFFMSPAQAGNPADVLPVSTDQIEFYRTAVGWVVYKNVTRQSCFATKQDGTSAIQMGLTKDKHAYYLGGFLKDYHVGSGHERVDFEVKGNEYYGHAHLVSRELTSGFKGAYVLVNNPNFEHDVTRSDSMHAFIGSPNAFKMNTYGAYFAVYEARECMKEF